MCCVCQKELALIKAGKEDLLKEKPETKADVSGFDIFNEKILHTANYAENVSR